MWRDVRLEPKPVVLFDFDLVDRLVAFHLGAVEDVTEGNNTYHTFGAPLLSVIRIEIRVGRELFCVVRHEAHVPKVL